MMWCEKNKKDNMHNGLPQPELMKVMRKQVADQAVFINIGLDMHVHRA